MAAWLYRAAAHLYGNPSVSEIQFSDIADDAWYLPYAQWAVFTDITRADNGSFEPDAAVTRADMAEMLVATFYHLATGEIWPHILSDTSGLPTTAIQAINGLYFAGVTKGCATSPSLRYCPTREVTRAQTATLIVQALQAEIPTIGLVQNEPGSAEGYTLITSNYGHKVYLIDHSGDKVHVWTIDDNASIFQAKLLENGNLMIMYDHPSNIDQTSVAEIDPKGRVIWEYSHPRLHHDFVPLSNGNVLLLYRETRTPEEAVAAGANPDYLTPKGLTYDNVMEVKPVGVDRGDIVWEWSLLDHLIQDYNPDQANYGTIADHPGRIDINFILKLLHKTIRADDLTHTNAIDYNPDLDQIMLSPRHFSELWVINHATTTEEAAGEKGDLLYRWGNPQIYQAGTADDQQLFWQHNTHWIPDGLPGEGNILVFNNGNGFRRFARFHTSVDEIIPPRFDGNVYQKDPHSAFGPDQPAWTYTAKNPKSFYAVNHSGAQRLPNGNTLILNGPRGTVFQVTPDETTVWKYINPILRDGTLLHQGDGIPIFSSNRTPYGYNHRTENRLHLVEWYPPDYPGLQKLDLTPKGPIELTR